MFTVLYSIYGLSVGLTCFPFLFLVCPFSEGKREGETERVGGWVVEMCVCVLEHVHSSVCIGMMRPARANIVQCSRDSAIDTNYHP